MHDSPLVGRRQAAGHLDREVSRLAPGQALPRQPPPQRLPFQKLRDQVGQALVRAHVVEDHDVGVVELAGRSGLLFEAVQPVGVACGGGQQHLERDVAADPGVMSAVHFAHSPRPEESHDLVRPQSGACGESHYTACMTGGL